MKRNGRIFSFLAGSFLATALLATTFMLSPAVVFAAKTSIEDRVESRITTLHSKLKITPTQEDQWGKVAQVMRDNAKDIEARTKTRDEKKSMTAIEDLKSYGEVAEAHADGIRKFTPVFEQLYSSMTGDQKKVADELFRHGDHTMGKKH
jgi:periplasmic protein CpxP/Spy